ncbi:MAG: phosphoribosylanthranilate isomerase [Flavisolibacter sp.]|jgi:phosphoribosylanthranilate isomerase
MMHIKICCIASDDEARLAISYGASAIGLVARMPSGPGPIADELIFSIAKKIPPPIATFLLTCETSVAAIADHHHRTCTNTIQIVDELTEGKYDELKSLLPAIKIVQVIHVTGEESIEEAVRISAHVDALLLDSGNPKLSVKELGGTGRVHNWQFSRKIVEQSKVPVFLAGGLNETNVRRAIDEVQPYGIDLCSGVRTNGKLDKEKLGRFFDVVRQ